MNKCFNTLRIIAISLLFLTGINAIIAGILFIIDSSGQKMGMNIKYLSQSPFTTFLIPGIILFVVNGLSNLITGILSIQKHKYYPILILIQGVLLCGWIIIQVIMVKDFNLLHFSMLLIGILLIYCGLILNRQIKTN